MLVLLCKCLPARPDSVPKCKSIINPSCAVFPHPRMCVKHAISRVINRQMRFSSARSEIAAKETKRLATTKSDLSGQAGDVLIVRVVDVGFNGVLAL